MIVYIGSPEESIDKLELISEFRKISCISRYQQKIEQESFLNFIICNSKASNT